MRYLLILLFSSSLLYAADQKDVKDKHDERESLLSCVLSLIDKQNEDWKINNTPEQERKRKINTPDLAKTLLHLPSFEKPSVVQQDKETHLKRDFFIRIGGKSVFVKDDATSGIDDPKRCLVKKRNIQIHNSDEQVITLTTKVDRKYIIWSSTAPN
ncbi:MAG TPA: hypothetical protein VFF04_03290 [Candidatus Babeliales bacterium]|nr:hypothetical protein [Candidatus Babeliales bacterium]